MSDFKIIAKKSNGVWFWYNKEKQELIRPIKTTDESFIRLNPKVKTEIRIYYENNKGNKLTPANSTVIDKYKNLNKFLKKEITGQDKCIDQLTKNLSSNEFNGWHTPNIGLFLGPTGVGKTYLAKKTNEFLNQDEKNFLRIDCNNPKYQNPNYNKQNIEEIAEFIKNHPNGIILLDEFEKIVMSKDPSGQYVSNGNSAFFTSFLNIFDDGYIKDKDNKKVSCKNNTFFMTSNIGSEILSTNDDLLGPLQMKKLLGQIFPPEFLGRISRNIFYFSPLKFKDLTKATDLVLNASDGLITKQLDKNKIQIKIDQESLKNIVLSACGVYHNFEDLADDESVEMNKKYSDDYLNLVQYHEAGHAIAQLSQMTDKEKKSGRYAVKRITSNPSGMAAGYTMDYNEEHTTPSRPRLLKECVELVAGKISEELNCHNSDLGWINDKDRENDLIANILLHFHSPKKTLQPEIYKEGYWISKSKDNKIVWNKQEVAENPPEKITEEEVIKEMGSTFVESMKKSLNDRLIKIKNQKKYEPKDSLSAEDKKIVEDISDLAGFDISKISFTQYIREDEAQQREQIAKLQDNNELWSTLFQCYESYIEDRARELLSKHKKETDLIVDGLKVKGTLNEKEIKFIWDKKQLPQSVLDIKKKTEEEQQIIKIDNGAEPISSSAGVRAIKNYIKNDLAYKFQELFEKGKIKKDSEIELTVDKDGKLSIKNQKERKNISKLH